MPTIWTNFIKEFSLKHGLKYACSLSKYKEPLKKAYKLFKEGKKWYEPINEIGVGGRLIGGNKWTDFVKDFAKKYNTTYGCSLSDEKIKNAYKLFKEGKEWYVPKLSATIETQTEEYKEPEPPKTPENIEPVVNRIEEKLKELEKRGSQNGAVSYDASAIIANIAFVNLLKKYGGECIVARIMEERGTNLGINLYPIEKQSKILTEEYYSRLGKSLKDCVVRGVELICVPLTLIFGKTGGAHANMLIYRPYKRIVERFEPHGHAYGNSESHNKSFNKQLKQLWEKDLTPYIGEVKYKDPAEICPDPKGFQALEGQLQGLKSEGGGFCSMWSHFLTEMTLINPTKSTKEIIDEVFKITERQPAYLKSVIRGYVLGIEKEIDVLLKILGTNGFKFGKNSSKILTLSSNALEKWILDAMFDSSKYSKAPPNFEPLPDTVIKGKDDKEKLKEIYYNKIRSLKKEDFITIYQIYGLYPPKLKVVDMPNYLINQLIDGRLDKYGATGINDINVILDEELHKKKGAFKPHLAREGYFTKKQEERDKAPKEEPKEEPKKAPKRRNAPKKEAQETLTERNWYTDPSLQKKRNELLKLVEKPVNMDTLEEDKINFIDKVKTYFTEEEQKNGRRSYYGVIVKKENIKLLDELTKYKDVFKSLVSKFLFNNILSSGGDEIMFNAVFTETLYDYLKMIKNKLVGGFKLKKRIYRPKISYTLH